MSVRWWPSLAESAWATGGLALQVVKEDELEVETDDGGSRSRTGLLHSAEQGRVPVFRKQGSSPLFFWKNRPASDIRFSTTLATSAVVRKPPSLVTVLKE